MVSWSDLAAVGGIIVGIIIAVIGALTFFAGGMSDAPVEGARAGRQGCIFFIVGTACIAICAWRLLA